MQIFSYAGTGCFTNVNRTVHLSEKAVDLPGEARSDLDIFLAYADAMDFTDNSGRPLIRWRTPEEAFDAWASVTAGRPVDYTGRSGADQHRFGSRRVPGRSRPGERPYAASDRGRRPHHQPRAGGDPGLPPRSGRR